MKIGDKVSVLDDAIDGVIININQSKITITTSDGFDMIFDQSELIIISDSEVNIQTNIGNINQAIKEKNITERPKNVIFKKSKNEPGVPDFDLHIEKLVKNYRAMSNYDILTLQLETAQRHMEFAIKNRIPKIVFIHGVGEGVLKSELEYLLKRYDHVVFQDANYQKYGSGATEVYFLQNR